MGDRFIRRIVTCDEKSINYRNLDATKQWLGPRQHAKVIVKKIARPQSNVVCLVEFWSCDSLRVCPNGRAVDAIFILNWNEFIKFWDVDIQYLLTEIEFSCSRTPYCTNNHDKNSGLRIIICFIPCPIPCVEEIWKTLKLRKGVSPNFPHQKLETCTVAGL